MFKKDKIKSVALILFLILHHTFYAENPRALSLTKVTPDGGVGITAVMCIGEDRVGFIWFGTNNGLFRYNSQEIKRYSYSQNNTNSIPSNRINQILTDQKGRLLIATEKGICLYNWDADNFIRLHLKDSSGLPIGNNIESLTQTLDAKYWLLDEKGVACFSDDFSYTEYIHISNTTSRARLLRTDSQGNLWVVYQNGDIYFKKPGKAKFQYFTTVKTGFPRALLVDDDKIWIGYDNNGLICINKTNGKIIREYNSENGLASKRIRGIEKAADGKLWVATYNGVAIIDGLILKTIINSNHYPTLPHHSIWSLYKDKNDIIWVGTWLGGLCYYSEYKNAVFHFTKGENGNLISNDVITTFALDPENKDVWFGTESGNLNCYNPTNNSLQEIEVRYEENKKARNIQSLAFDKKGKLWVGTRGDGILFKDKNNITFKHFSTPFLNGLQNLCIMPQDDGIWISDYQQGIFFYSFINKTFKQYKNDPKNPYSLSDNHVRKIINDSKGNLWLATENGLNLLKKGESNFIHFSHIEGDSTSLSSDYI